MTNLGGGDIKWRVGATSGRCGLKNFLSQKGSRVTLPAGIIGLALIFSKCWDKCARKKAKKWRFGDFEVPPDWKEGVKSKNCYDRSIPRAKLPPCTNFQRKIWQNVRGCTLGFYCTNINRFWKVLIYGAGPLLRQSAISCALLFIASPKSSVHTLSQVPICFIILYIYI